MIGTTLHQYRIVRAVGSGGMGEVYAAEDLRLRRLVALKILPREMAADPDRLLRFRREAQVVASLNHPNIVTLYGVEEADGVHFLTMELVEGKTLAELMPAKGFALPDLLRMGVQLADAVSVAHQRGVIHRDLKPANVMLTEDRRLKVLDFGLAKATGEGSGPMDRTATELVTEEHVVMGTTSYMSPEQAEGQTVDARSDIFSLGVVLYEMATGARPFGGRTPMAVLSAIMKDAARPLTELKGDLPQELERIVGRCLAKDPGGRYQDAADLRLDLERLQESTAPGRAAAPAAARRLLWAAAGLAILAIGVASYLALTRVRGVASDPSGDPPPAGEFTQITTRHGIEWFPSFSPDGKWMVYAANEGGPRHIFLQSVTGQTAIDLTKDSQTDEDQPAFSPDGERIAFRSSRDGGGIFVMGRTGEAVRRVTRAGFRPAWSPDGTRIAYTTENVDINPQNPTGTSELWIVSISTGETRRVTDMDATLAAWSPHDKQIAFARRAGFRSIEIWTVPAGGGPPVQVTEAVANEWTPAWSPDGAYLYYASDRSGSMNLWRVRIDESSGKVLGAPQAVPTPAPSLAHPTISSDGRKIMYASAFVTANVEKLALDPSSATVKGEPSPVTTGTRRWSSPDPSPDGSRVAFYSHVRPEGDLYITRADGSDLQQITSDESVDRLPRWSPDGQWLGFFSARRGRFDLWKIRPDGSELQQLTDGGGPFVWSPDGGRVASLDPLAPIGSKARVMVFDVSRGKARHSEPLPPLDNLPGRFIANSWSPDGERLAGHLELRNGGIATYSFSKRRYEVLVEFGEWPVWLPDDRRMLFVANGNSFYIVDSRTKQVRKVFSVQRDVIGPPRLTRDGKVMFFTRRSTESDIWMMTLR